MNNFGEPWNQSFQALRQEFTGANGNKLVGDQFGANGAPVLLLHGGGQTRHAWQGTAAKLAQSGLVALALDQRGHGDSDWTDSYTFHDYAADARIVADELARRHGKRPVAIGASLGGIAVMFVEGEATQEGRDAVFSALVLVDITPRVDDSGLQKIHGFMRAYAEHGFASIEEAADAVAEYLPHRPRPRSLDGLKKNLRLAPDGRWRWHWDPRFMGEREPGTSNRAQSEASMIAAARSFKMPVLLVRGSSSELIKEQHVREFRELVPHADYADVAGARHMVAGDKNDAFSAAILNFLSPFNR